MYLVSLSGAAECGREEGNEKVAAECRKFT
jgi:hypothetical protein